MRTPEYERLLDMLTEHPEFSGIEDNPCDTEIIAYGSYLWEKWNEEEEAAFDDLTGLQSTEELLARKNVTAMTRDIVQMLLDGAPSTEIRAKHGISVKRLASIKYDYRVGKEPGVPVQRKKYNIDSSKLLEDLERLGNVKAVADEYGMPRSSLAHFIKRNNIQWSPKSKADLISLDAVIDMQKQCGTQLATAVGFGVSEPTFKKALKRLGVTWKEVLEHAA